MKVHELIANPRNWGKHQYVVDMQTRRTANGLFALAEHKLDRDDVKELDPAQCKFCILGAIAYVYGPDGDDGGIIYKVREAIGDGYVGIWEWNDNSTHAEVLRVVKGLDI